jgi:hypothetical protein
MTKLNIKMKKFAEVGAAMRVTELKAELESLYRHFPGLRAGRKSSGASSSPSKERKRSTMSTSQKKAVSLRMKKYWAGRKAAETKKQHGIAK